MNMRDKIRRVLDQSFGPFSDGVVDRMADYIAAGLPDYDAQQARIDKLEDALDWFAKGYFINEFASGQEMAERIVRRAQGALKGSEHE